MGEVEAAPRAKWPVRKPLRQLNARHYPVAQLLVQGRKLRGCWAGGRVGSVLLMASAFLFSRP
jgi:hypothetical protein